MEQISSRKPVARKEYCCDYCRNKIEKGQRYYRSFWKDDVAYEWIAHLECQFIVNELWDYYDPAYGVDSENFGEMCHDFCQNFICLNRIIRKCYIFSIIIAEMWVYRYVSRNRNSCFCFINYIVFINAQADCLPCCR